MMSTVASRAAGAIVGAFIADAATLPVHWVYDQAALAEAAGKQSVPEFLPEMICPFYRLPTGKNSAYGDHLYALLKSVVESQGYNRKAYEDSLVAVFGPGSVYDYERTEKPSKGPWINGSMKKFLTNKAAGEENTGNTGSHDMDGVDNATVIAALYAGGRTQMLQKMEETVSVVQNVPKTIKFAQLASILLELFIIQDGGLLSNPDAIAEMKKCADAEVLAEIEKALALKDVPHTEAAKNLGITCPVPGNFLTSLHCLQAGTSGKFIENIRPTILAGGDNCSRAIFLGACFGAQVGLEGLPSDLLAKVERGEEVKALAEQLVAMRK